MDIFPSKISPGTTALFETTVRQAIPFQLNEQLVDGTIVVSILDPFGTLILTEAPMSHVSLGRYTYNYTFLLTAPLGIYTVIIKASVMGNVGVDTTHLEVTAVTNLAQ